MTISKRLDAGLAADLKPNQTKRLVAGQQRILVCNIADQYYAVDDRCTHEDASLFLGCIKAGKIHCSLHGGEFDPRTGMAVTEPAEGVLRTYPVLIEDGRLWVEV